MDNRIHKEVLIRLDIHDPLSAKAFRELQSRIAELEAKLAEREWVSVEDRLPARYPVWLYHKDWVDQDFNPEGKRDGFAKYGNPDDWVSAQWEGNLGRYVTSYDVPTHWQRQSLPKLGSSCTRII